MRISPEEGRPDCCMNRSPIIPDRTGADSSKAHHSCRSKNPEAFMTEVDFRFLPVITGMIGNDDLKACVIFETRPDMNVLGDRVRGKHYESIGDRRNRL